MELTMFQTTIIAALTAVMVQPSAHNANKNGSSANSTKPGGNQGHQRVCSCKDTPNHKPKNSHDNGEILPKKRQFWTKRKGCPTQGPAKRQQAVGNCGKLPKCNKCNYHHIRFCQELHCNNCNRNGHTTRFCRMPAQQTTLATIIKEIRALLQMWRGGALPKGVPKY